MKLTRAVNVVAEQSSELVEAEPYWLEVEQELDAPLTRSSTSCSVGVEPVVAVDLANLADLAWCSNDTTQLLCLLPAYEVELELKANLPVVSMCVSRRLGLL